MSLICFSDFILLQDSDRCWQWHPAQHSTPSTTQHIWPAQHSTPSKTQHTKHNTALLAQLPPCKLKPVLNIAVIEAHEISRTKFHPPFQSFINSQAVVAFDTYLPSITSYYYVYSAGVQMSARHRGRRSAWFERFGDITPSLVTPGIAAPGQRSPT